MIALEFASGNGEEERDVTPLSRSREGEVRKPGKFWVYEQIMRIPYYGIYEIKTGNLEVYHWIDGNYHKLQPNEQGHYPIPPLQVELGLWQGNYQNQTQLWLRWWDLDGNLLLIGSERAEQEKQRADAAEAKAALLAERLRALGIDPDE
jgi:Putative restriction endonuclease